MVCLIRRIVWIATLPELREDLAVRPFEALSILSDIKSADSTMS